MTDLKSILETTTLMAFSFVALGSLALLSGCGKGASPVAAVGNSSVAVTVPLTDVHGKSFGATQVNILYYFSANSGQPVTGTAGTVSVATGSSFTLTQTGNYNYVAIQLNDATSNQTIAIGAATITGNSVPITLGPVNKSVYEVNLGAGQAVGFEADSIVNVGLTPTPTPSLDVYCTTTQTGFELSSLGGASSNVAYLGNGNFLDFLKAPATSAFQATSVASKALQTTSTDLAPGDVFAVQLAKGYAWLQITSVTGSGIAFQYRVNTTLPYCGYELTTADTYSINNANATATPTPQTTISVQAVLATGGSPLDVALYGPTNQAAQTIFISSGVSMVYVYGSSGASITGFSGAGLQSSAGLAIDPTNDFLYVADPTSKKVDQFSLASPISLVGAVDGGVTVSTADNSTLALTGALADPRYLALDLSGDLYVTDPGAAGVADVLEYLSPITTATGMTVNYWTGSLDTVVSSNGVGQVAAAGTTLVVANSANNRIDLYSQSESAGFAGSPLASFNNDNNLSGAVTFNHPQGVAYSPSTGYLYISDTGNDRIVEMTLGGSFVRVIGPTIGSSTLDQPTGIKVDQANPPFIYVANTGAGQVLKLQ